MTHLARVDADAHERAMDPVLADDDVLRTITASLVMPRSEMTSAEMEQERAILRGAMRAYLERTGAEEHPAADEGSP